MLMEGDEANCMHHEQNPWIDKLSKLYNLHGNVDMLYDNTYVCVVYQPTLMLLQVLAGNNCLYPEGSFYVNMHVFLL